MRIVEIEAHEVLPPYQDFNALALARYHGRSIQVRSILVVRADNGLEGYGEAWGGCDPEGLRQRYLGTDPFDWINAGSDLPMNMALYDLMGKHLGIPAWKLLGPKARSWIPVAAWTVSQPPEGMAQEVRMAARQGYHWLKYHVDEIQNVIDQTEAMQQAAPRAESEPLALHDLYDTLGAHLVQMLHETLKAHLTTALAQLMPQMLDTVRDVVRAQMPDLLEVLLQREIDTVKHAAEQDQREA